MCPTPLSFPRTLFQAFKKDGGIDLYLMQTRPHEWPDGRLGILLKLEGKHVKVS